MCKEMDILDVIVTAGLGRCLCPLEDICCCAWRSGRQFTVRMGARLHSYPEQGSWELGLPPRRLLQTHNYIMIILASSRRLVALVIKFVALMQDCCIYLTSSCILSWLPLTCADEGIACATSHVPAKYHAKSQNPEQFSATKSCSNACYTQLMPLQARFVRPNP